MRQVGASLLKMFIVQLTQSQKQHLRLRQLRRSQKQHHRHDNNYINQEDGEKDLPLSQLYTRQTYSLKSIQ